MGGLHADATGSSDRKRIQADHFAKGGIKVVPLIICRRSGFHDSEVLNATMRKWPIANGFPGRYPF